MPQDLSRSKLHDLYMLAAGKIEEALTHAKHAILALCDNDKAGLQDHAKHTIEVEKEADAIHDEIIARMYTKETLVFSRQDRGYLISVIDDLVDSADSAVRRASLYFPAPAPALQTILRGIGQHVGEVGTEAKHLVLALFTDFDEATSHVRRIEDIKRESILAEHDFLMVLYETNPPMPDLLYFDRTGRKIVKIIKSAKRLASAVNGLIFKYHL